MGKVATLKFQASDGSVFEIQKKPGGYRITKEGEPGISSISKTSIEQRGRAGGWVLLKEGSGVVGAEPDAPALNPDAAAVATPKIEPTVPALVEPALVSSPAPSTPGIHIMPISRAGSSQTIGPSGSIEPLPMPKGVDIAAALVLLDAGSRLAYRRANGREIRVEKKGDLYWVYEKDDAGFVTLGADGLRQVAEEERWQTVETLAPLGAQGEVKPDGAEQDAKIAKLREAVTAARTAFITVEESQTSSWKKLMQTFRTLTHKESDDREVQKYHSEYDQALLALQEAELEKLKRSGKAVQELRPEMAALIREFQFDEAERIYTERRQQRLEKTNRPLSEKLDARWKETIGGLEAEPGTGEKWKEYIRYIIGATADVGGSAVQGIESLGKANNEFSKKYGKYILTATVTVGGAVALGAATGGVASVAIGALALKRLAAGAGLAVTAEAGMEEYATSRRAKKRENVETDQASFFKAMEDKAETAQVAAIATGKEVSGEIDLSKLEAFLKDEAVNARHGEGARRRNALLRKSGAIFAGVVLGSGAASHFAHGLFSEKASVVAGASTADVAPASGEVPTPTIPDVSKQVADSASTGGPVGGAVISNSVEAPASAGPVTPDAAGVHTAAAPVEQGVGISAKTQAFLSTYEVKRGDNIWKLAEQTVRGIPGMEGRHSEHFAKLVELKLQAKLDASPELARAAGFVANADGKYSVHSIQTGAKLEIGKLISADEMTTLVEEAKNGALTEASTSNVPSVTNPPIDTPVGKGSGRGLTLDSKMGLKIPQSTGVDLSPARPETVIISPSVGSADGAVESRPEAELLNPKGNVMTYVESLSREDQEKLFRNFKRVSDEIFQTDEVMNSEGYHRNFNPTSHSELVKTKLAVVLADHNALTSNPLTSYDRASNPLHWSQMESIAKLVKASGKTLGAELARARSGESIQEYVLRVVALAGNEGKKIPGFRMLN
jgi:hypothetical protein